MMWWSTWVSVSMTVLLVVSAIWGVVGGGMTLAIWCMIGFVTSGSFSLIVVYLFMPIARTIVARHVILLATSYALWTLMSLLHGLGLSPHDESSAVLWVHFGVLGSGVLGFCLLVVACLTGFLGLILAARAVDDRIRGGDVTPG
jgi:hypothetical protein